MAHILYNGEKHSVLSTETFSLPKDATELWLEMAGTKFGLIFRNDDGETRGEFDPVTLESKTHVAWFLYNFKSQIGQSFDSRVGDIDGRSLRVSVMVQTLTKGDNPPRQVTMTFLLEGQE